MNRSSKFLNIFIKLFFSAVYSLSLVYALTSSLLFDFKPYGLFASIFALTCFWYGVFYNKLSTKIFLIASVTFLLCSITYMAFTNKLSKFILMLTSFSAWVTEYTQGYAALDVLYKPYLALLICIMVSFLSFIFTVRRFNLFVILSGGILIFLIQWEYNMFESYSSFFIFLMMAFIYYFLHIYKSKEFLKHNSYASFPVFSLWMALISLSLVLICISIPAPSKPLEIPWMDKKVNAFFNHLNNSYSSFSSPGFFSISSSGFGESSSLLGGKVKLDKTLVMKVQSPGITYLRGSCMEIYDGSKWSGLDRRLLPIHDNISIIEDENFEMASGIKLLAKDSGAENKYLTQQTVRIWYKNLSLRTIFAPSKTFRIDFKNKGRNQPFIDQNNIFSVEKRLNKDLEYEVKSYKIVNKDGDFYKLLQKSKQGLYNEFISMYSSPILPYMPDYKDLDRLSRMSIKIYSEYLQLPRGLPKRIKDLALTVTADCTNNYDKAKAIENYLSQNYTYTLNPPKTPRGMDFVDHFLFESKEGYCTYYATSMVILVRHLGIPARYVEGYVLPPTPDTNNTYNVTNEQAHAWVEVYFDGFGWLPFEPTAPFRAAFYNTNNASTSISQNFAADSTYRDYLLRMRDYGNTGINVDLDLDAAAYAATNTKNNLAALVVVLVLLSLIVILLFIVLFNILRHNYRMHKIRALPPKDSILQMYSYYLKVLSRTGYPVKSGETPLQYTARVCSYIIYSRTSAFKEITDKFLIARYSPNEVTDADKQQVLEFYKYIISESKKELGKLKFFTKRYVIGNL